MFFGAWDQYLRTREYDRVNKANMLEAQRIFNENRLKQENKMTREDAEKKIAGYWGSLDAPSFVKSIEALGLIKFDEPKKPSYEKGKYIFFPSPDEGKDNVSVLQSDAVETMKKYGFRFDTSSLKSIKINEDGFFGVQYGIISIEQWPEGLVIWVGGEIVYRSWKS